MKTSINIKYDLGDTSLLDGYYATNAHSALIKSLLKGFMHESSLRSHIAYGPYGSGKSYISTLLTSFFANAFGPEGIDKVAEKFGTVDEDIEEILTEYSRKKSELTYLPIILNGYEGDLYRTIIRSLARTIRDNNINVTLPGTHEEILNIIERWKTHYLETYMNFTHKLQEHNWNEEAFIESVKKREEEVVAVFDSVYKDLTGGGEFVSFDSYELIETLETVSKQLKEKGYGIFLVYDEFGRMLQNLRSNIEINAFMQTLQDLAELANNGVDNFSILFIAHRPISFYFSFTDKAMRNEFAKVEKRFSVHEIRSDYSTFLKITEQYIKNNLRRKNLAAQKTNDLLKNLKKYNVFYGDLTDTEIENVIVKRLHPLHPIATYLLPKMSSVFGQNERTLFTFLIDKANHGLTGFHEKNPKSLYYADYLVDYFLSGIDETYIEDIKEYRIYRKNIESIPGLIPEAYIEHAYRVYKFLLVWTMTKGHPSIQLTTDFISFSLGIPFSEVEDSLELLENRKLVRYNVVKEQWEIFEGSPVDIEKLIEKQKGETPFKAKDFIETLESYNPHQFVRAEGHNIKHEITRFAQIQFVTSDITDSFKESEFCDYNIIFAFDFDYQLSGDNKAIEVKRISTPDSDIKSSTHRLKVINKMLDDTYLIRNYPNIDVELEYEKDKIKVELKKFYDQLIETHYTGKKNLQEHLDKRFDELYPHTFYIVNDQINMFKLTNIQKKAINQVIDTLLSKATNDLSNVFTGSKPADLVYYTVIEKVPHQVENSEALENLEKQLNDYILANPKGKLENLLDIVVSPPFGVRPRVGLLMMFSLIIEKWKDMLLFSGDSFIPSIATEELVENILNKEGIQYVFSRFDNENRKYLEALEEIFDYVSESTKEKTLSVRVCSGMYNWYLNLPVITQQMVDISLSQRRFLSIVAKSRINPKNAIDELLDTFSIDSIEQFKMSIEEHFESYKNKLIASTFTKLGVNDPNKWAKQQKQIHKKNNKLVKTLIDEKNVFDEYAKSIENIEAEKWTQSSFKTLKSTIINDFNKIENNDNFQVLYINGKEKHVQDVELSKKAENTLMNLDATIDATKRYYSNAELEQIVLKLMNKYIS